MLLNTDLARQVMVDSAGTYSYRPGSPPGERSLVHAARRVNDLSDLSGKCRLVVQLNPERTRSTIHLLGFGEISVN